MERQARLRVPPTQRIEHHPYYASGPGPRGYVHPYVDRDWGAFSFILIFFFLFFLLLVAFTLPAATLPPPTKSSPPPTIVLLRNSPDKCVIGETFDVNTGLCMPKVNTPVAMDRSIVKDGTNACDGFFDHACGRWIESHENENRAFSSVYAKNEKEVEKVVMENQGGIRAFYDSCVNTLVENRRRSAGGDHETLLERNYMVGKVLRQLVHYEDLPRAFAQMTLHGFTIPFTVMIENYPDKAEMVPLVQYLSLPVPSGSSTLEFFELVDGRRSPVAQRKAQRLEAMLQQLSVGLPEDPLQGQTFFQYVESKQLEKDTYTWQQFTTEISSHFDWETYVRHLGLQIPEDQDTWVLTPGYFRWFNPRDFTVEDWRIYLEYSILLHTHEFFPQLPEDVYYREHDGLHPLRRRIAHLLPPRVDTEQAITAKDCLKATKFMLPGLIAQDYLQDFFPQGEETRQRVQVMTEKIRDHYAELVGETPWMDQDTKTKAKEKIESIIVRVLHPNQWQPEPFNRQMAPDRYLRNVNIVRKYRVERNLDLWRKNEQNEFDRDRISMFSAPLSTVNAWYSPTTNTITVFAGILQYPFYHPRFNEPSMYASIGMVVSHELSHAMDNTGRLFDKDGSLVDWWTEESRRGFMEESRCIVNEYNEIPEGCNAEEVGNYGEQTLGEDIADTIGFRLAYETYFDNRPDAPLSVKQHFFYSFAQMWCSHYDVEHTCGRVHDDVHAIAQYRVDKTLKHIEYFQEAFNCHHDSFMAVDEGEKQCQVYGSS